MPICIWRSRCGNWEIGTARSQHYEASLKEYPDQDNTPRELAEFYLSLGRRTDAVRIADQAIAHAEKLGNAELVKTIQEWKRTRNLDAGSASENGEAR